MKKNRIVIASVIALFSCLAVGNIALAAWVSFDNDYFTYYDHGYGVGFVDREDYWDQYWDSGQSKYTYYNVLPTSYGGIYVSPSGDCFVYGVYTSLIKSDQTTLAANYADTEVYFDEYLHKHWPPIAVEFSKLDSNDPSMLYWRYQWNVGVLPHFKFTWDEFWYANQSYVYDYWE